MDKHGDIYRKVKKDGGPVPGYEPINPEMHRPPHRRALVLLVLMLLVMAAIGIFYYSQEAGKDSSGFEHLLTREGSTNRPAASAATGTAASIEALLTDLGSAQQEPPPTLSPQKMAEAMAHVRSAQQYIRSRDMDAAEREVGKALQVWPDMNIGIRLLGSIYTQRGQFDQAILLLEKSLAREPFSAETLNNLAINYMQKGQMGKAEELLITSLQIRPDYAVAFINLGFVHLRVGRYDLAAENFEAGLQTMPDNPGVLNNLAVCLIRLGDYEGARTRLQRLIDLVPTRATAYLNMAISYVLERDYDTALDFVRRGAEHCTPSQLQAYLADSDFDTLRPHPEFQRIVRERFPDIPAMPPAP
jgi:Flp pilus assembly protein TadD